MRSEELADHTVTTGHQAAERILTVGAEQYELEVDGEIKQKFELLRTQELFQYTDEELLDLVSYVTMIRLRMNRILSDILGRQLGVEKVTDEERLLLKWALSYVVGAAQEHQDDETGQKVASLAKKLGVGDDEPRGAASTS